MKTQGKNTGDGASREPAGKTLEAQEGDAFTAVLTHELLVNSWEYFCHGCGQLRLWLRSENPPTGCTHCGSEAIECERPGSERLGALRAKRSGVAPHLDDRVGEAVDPQAPPKGG